MNVEQPRRPGNLLQTEKVRLERNVLASSPQTIPGLAHLGAVARREDATNMALSTVFARGVVMES